MPIDLNLLDQPINRYILARAEESVGRLEQAGGETWWHLVVSLPNERYAATPFRSLSPLAASEGFDFFKKPLQSLVESPIIPEVQVVEQSEIGTEAAKDLAYESPGRVLVVTDQGKFIGIVYQGQARGGFETTPLLEIFGDYTATLISKDSTPPEEVEQPSRASPRYANAVLQNKSGDLLDSKAPLPSGFAFKIRLDIGKLSKESAVINPEPIPEHLLPQDIWLDVVLSSTDFSVSASPTDVGHTTASGRFFLKSDGSPATTENGDRYLFFYLLAPPKSGTARLRINYYFHNHLVQSQLLTAGIGESQPGYFIKTDYTLSYSLLDIGELPARAQISILTNTNGGSHQIYVRQGDQAGNLVGQACTYYLKAEQIDKLVDDLRAVLRDKVALPTEKRCSKGQLQDNLRQLAPIGRQLWTLTVGQCLHEVYRALKLAQDGVIQVSRPTTSDYTFPWGLVYDISLSEGPENWKFCSLVEQWDDQASPQTILVEPGTRRCPKVPNGIHPRDTLCPFGFWGYLHDIEQLSSTDTPIRRIPIHASLEFDMAAALTQYNVERRPLNQHIKAISTALKSEFPHGKLNSGKDLATVKSLLGKDLPFIYFLCHGARDTDADPDTYLSIGDQEKIRARDFIDWVQEWFLNDDRVVWDKIRPLIFINACHSLEISNKTLVSYLDAFLTTGHAAGVIGTEVRVRPAVAMDIAQEFYKLFFKGVSVGQALHQIRTDYLAHGNLYGLIYTAYCWSDLAIERQ
jgi:hypothetical protein